MILNSIRWRVQLWHGLLLVVVLAVFGMTAYRVAEQDEWRRIDRELEQHMEAALRPSLAPGGMPAGAGGPPPGEFPFRPRPGDQPPPFPDFAGGARGPGSPERPSRPEPRLFQQAIVQAVDSLSTTVETDPYFVFWNKEGRVLARTPNAPQGAPMPGRPAGAQEKSTASGDREQGGWPSGPDGREPAGSRSRGKAREVFRVLPMGECLLTGRTVESEKASLRGLALSFVGAGSAVLLLGLAGGWWLATRAIRPIQVITDTAGRIAAGDLTQRIGIAETDSELGQMAGVLNATFARLEAAFQNQARFTSDASHELRTPVTVILAQTQTALTHERSPQEYRQTLEACQRAAQRMRRLIESLLALARLDAGQEPLRRDPFDLAAVASESAEMLRPLAAERNIELTCECEPAGCTGDAERMGGVVANLLTNAIHFNREGGSVRVRVHSRDGSGVLTVEDTGEGIPAEDLPRIFERFYRVDRSRARGKGQNGLGLSIAKAIVEAHRGTISASSQPGAGSIFTVDVPLAGKPG
jgi:two-component system, OmpR family, sensor kinase